MFFALGLGRKLKDFPTMTLFIVLVCSINYFFFQETSKPYLEITTLKHKLESSSATIELFDEYIVSVGGEADLEESQGIVHLFSSRKYNSLFTNKKPISINKKVNLLSKNAVFRKKKYSNFLRMLRTESNEILVLSSYEKYKENLLASKLEHVQVVKEYHLLSKQNITFGSVINAMFSHGSFLHLFGNMLFFVVFGVYVEQRIGGRDYLLCYFFLGSFSLVAYVLSQDDSSYTTILGASANVSAVMGMFYLAFYHHKIRMFVWYFFVWKTIWMSIRKYFLPLFILQDIVMSFVGTDNVAHLAHLYGFIFGLIYMHLWNREFKLPTAFLYPYEYEAWKRLKNSEDQNYLKQINMLLTYNPGNWVIKDKLRKIIFKKLENEESLNEDMHESLENLIPDYITSYYNSKTGSEEFFFNINSLKEDTFIRYFKSLSQKKILFVINKAIEFEEHSLSILFIHVYYTKYPFSKKLMNLGKTLNSIIETTLSEDSIQKLLKQLSSGSTSRRFSKIIKIHIDKIESERS
jgi:membrane associated rhomboid family serine protease